MAEAHKWEFKARFRRHAFGWKSQPAITRIKQAVAEIKKVAKKDPVLAAEGAIAFLSGCRPRSSTSTARRVPSARRSATPSGSWCRSSRQRARRREDARRLARAVVRGASGRSDPVHRAARRSPASCARRRRWRRRADKLVGITRMALSPQDPARPLPRDLGVPERGLCGALVALLARAGLRLRHHERRRVGRLPRDARGRGAPRQRGRGERASAQDGGRRRRGRRALRDEGARQGAGPVTRPGALDAFRPPSRRKKSASSRGRPSCRGSPGGTPSRPTSSTAWFALRTPRAR